VNVTVSAFQTGGAFTVLQARSIGWGGGEETFPHSSWDS